MKKLNKLYISLLAAFVLIAPRAVAQDSTAIGVLTAGVAANIVTGKLAISSIQVTSAGTNAVCLVYFYDSNTNGAAGTNYPRRAFTNVTSYATNINQVLTNSEGFVFTNTFVGTYTLYSLVASNTIQRPKIMTTAVPAGQTRVKDGRILTGLGLTAVASDAAVVEVNYVTNP